MDNTASNIPIFSVSQISQEVRRTIEDRFEQVRIRGEASRPTKARSGHFYVTLKDERAVIDAVAWKGVAARLPFDVTEGMELIATGKLTTYPGQSKYQLIIESLELAGEGALLKLLEDRRRALMAEGLFDPSRKKSLPLLPRSIGVISSPNGAVIRDIWHRVRDRYPMEVLLWPVLVQGKGAAAQIARAIQGFTALPHNQRPDVLIVARGGGSLEDLWTFNEEEVVRAAAACPIPLISAIGHETDTTLLDFAADVRAPTPTAAAEFSVPVRADLLHHIDDAGQRLRRAISTRMTSTAQGIKDVSRALADPDALLARAAQDLDIAYDRLSQSIQNHIQQAVLRFGQSAARLTNPSVILGTKKKALTDINISRRFSGALQRIFDQGHQNVETLRTRLYAIEQAREKLRAKGWVTVTDVKGQTITSANHIKPKQPLSLHFHDGIAEVIAATKTKPEKTKTAQLNQIQPDTQQDSLF